jgi:tetratricopeptide (TPR) repeat protein
MTVEKTHLGTFLLCRTVSPSFADGEVTTVVEDLNGDAEVLSLFNFQDSYCGDPNGWLPEGQILIIKEPFLMSWSGVAEQLLKCDSPSDIEFIDPWNATVLGRTAWYRQNALTFDEAKARGNHHFANREYEAALRLYDLALQLQSNHPIILLNRSIALLHLDRNYEAFECAKLALDSGSTELNQEKLFYHLATAAYRLRDWDSAIAHYEKLAQLMPGNAQCKDGLERARARLAESQTGEFDIRALSQSVAAGMKRDTVYRVDAADYIGPVEVVDIPGKGKGIVVSRDVKRGTLLIAAKPLAWSDAKKELQVIPFMRNRQKTMMEGWSKANLLLAAARFVVKNPHRRSEFYSHWDGKERRETFLPQDVIDAHRIRSIALLNAFQVAYSLLGTSGSAKTKEEIEDRLPIGLYGLPSFCNHSCAANANHHLYGDLIMIYAVEDLARGEEVTIDYLAAGHDIHRQARFQRSFGFQCSCPMCLEQSHNPFMPQREAIWCQIEAIVQREYTRSDVPEMEELIEQLETTYHDDKYRVNLAAALSTIADWYVRRKEHQKAILAFQKALACSATRSPVGILRVVWCAKMMRLAWDSVNDEFVIPAKRAMLDLVRVHAGVSDQVFYDVWVPALIAWEDTHELDLILPLTSIECEADLAGTREARSRSWVSRPLERQPE